MQPALLLILQAAFLLSLFPSAAAHAQTLPPDFRISATVGGASPWEEKINVTIDNAGHGTSARYVTGENPAVIAESTFTVSMDGLSHLWKTIQDSSFFSLPAERSDSTVQEGEFAKVTVTANGQSRQVIIRNIAEPKLQGILGSLNAIIPPTLHLFYSPPGSFNITPIDPCGSPGSLGVVRTLKARPWFDTRNASVAGTTSVSRGVRSVAADPILPHAGTVVAYNMSIQDAIRNKVAKLSSKGEFFGDGVSITVDNTITPPSNTITITLFLEFYGPLATKANIDPLKADIVNKWNGLKTSSGKTINISIVTRADAGTANPPSTPGYHQIKLVPAGTGRSSVNGGPKPNEGVGNCVWVLGRPKGVYGHEAGHLMGLPDKYDDYHKQANGAWSNDHTGQSYPNDKVFAADVITKYPGLSLNTVLNALKTTDVYSVPMDGSENDLMANTDKKPLQKDIDQITANPGVLVNVPAGTALINRSSSAQMVVTSHRDDLFVKPGEKRTQNGIYIVCIDHDKEVPAPNDMFDVAPPLETWNGIAAAASMITLTQYIDSAGLYCGKNSAVQEAVWRITDNATPLHPSDVDAILKTAGVDIGGQIMDFPHFSPGPSNDSLSQPIIPNELFVAAITPRFADGRAGSPVSLKASVGVPSVTSLLPNYTWTATGPDTAPVTVTAADSTGTLTPTQSGIYEVGLQFSFNDSLYGPRAFKSDRKAYVIVSDEYTETFEHSGLADKFPWTSTNDVPWTISDANAQTGTSAAQPGAVQAGQQSTLAITVSLPADSAIGFSVRTAFTQSGSLSFSIDSTRMDDFFGLSDWRMLRYPLAAGRHLLTWVYAANGSNTPGSVWVDNIFFPGAVAVTAVEGTHDALPREFALEQNYPNPFNPVTTIRYALPHRSSVSLVVYNALGQKVADLMEGMQEAGYHQAAFDGSKLSSGVYFYTLRAAEFMQTRKVLLVK